MYQGRVQLLVVCEAIPVLVKQLKAPPPTREENQYQHLVEMASAVFMLKNLANEYPQLIVDAGAVSHLLYLLKRPINNNAVKRLITIVIDAINILASTETEGGIPPLIELLQSVDMELKLSGVVVAYACLDTYGQWFHNGKNIPKITKAMKMVAASKLRAIQIRIEKSRGLWQPFSALLGDLPSFCTS
ncbi:hypothetical protein OROHE_007341 [Orobanche hederae]